MYNAAFILLNHLHSIESSTNIIDEGKEGKQDGVQNTFLWSTKYLDIYHLLKNCFSNILFRYFSFFFSFQPPNFSLNCL